MKDQFNKVMWILRQIVEHREGITLKEIQTRWERSPSNSFGNQISRRSFMDYCRSLESLFDIRIICDASNHYRYRLDHPEEFYKDGLKSWVLSSFATNMVLQESKGLRQRVIFEDIPSGQPHLLPILGAMREGKTIELVYQNYWDVEKRRIAIKPYLVRMFNRRWYVIGPQAEVEGITKENDGEQLQRYALDRILKLELRPETFTLPHDFDASDYFAGCFGIIVDPEEADIEVVKVRVSDINHKRDYFRSLPIHDSQEEIETDEHSSIFQYTLRPSYDFMQELLSHGEEVELLEPLNLREHFKQRITALLQLYS